MRRRPHENETHSGVVWGWGRRVGRQGRARLLLLQILLPLHPPCQISVFFDPRLLDPLAPLQFLCGVSPIGRLLMLKVTHLRMLKALERLTCYI